jgi:hypothetical protein
MHIHIDSSQIDKKNKLNIINTYILDNNPLRIEKDLLWIKLDTDDNKVFLNNKIILNGIEEKKIIIKTLIKTEDGFVSSLKFAGKYLQINSPPLLDHNLETILQSDIHVDINGFKTGIGNISVNDLNRSHKIIYKNSDYFLIQLNNIFDNTKWHTIQNSYNISLKFKHYGGIPLDILELPYIVQNTQNDEISIRLPFEGFFKNPFGGDTVTLSVVSNIIKGYPNVNNYHIDLDRKYKVNQIEISGAIFPNSMYNINLPNNKLYYQYIDNPEILFVIFPEKKYEVDEFIEYFNNSQKQDHDNITINITNNMTIFTSYSKFRIRMDFDDSINILGFRNIGKPGSITKYDHIINNTDLYESETNSKELIFPPIKFNKQEYILMLLNNYNNINTLRTNITFFTKIIPKEENTIIVPNKIIFNEPQELSFLDIQFIDSEGRLINFGNRDHSFILSFN